MGTANRPLTFLRSHPSCEFRSTCAMHCGRCRSKSLGLYVICTATTTARPSHSSPFVSQFTADVAFPLSQSIWGRRCWTTQNWHSDVGECGGEGLRTLSQLCSASRNWGFAGPDLCFKEILHVLCTNGTLRNFCVGTFLEPSAVHHWLNKWWTAEVQHFRVKISLTGVIF